MNLTILCDYCHNSQPIREFCSLCNNPLFGGTR